MPCWPVSHQDGKYQVTDSDGILYPITMGGVPVQILQPGWQPVGLQTGLKPFHLLELRNDQGPIRDAVWYLNEDLNYENNEAGRFTGEQAEAVVSSLSPLLRDIYEHSLCAPAPEIADAAHAFDGINPIFIRELIEFVVGTALSPPELVPAARLDANSSHIMTAGVRLSASLLRHSLDIAQPEHLQTRLTLPSPFDAALLTAQERFAPDDGALSQAYRFHDPAGGLAFYLLFATDGAPALYIPAANIVFASGEGPTGAQVMTALFTHYASHADRPLDLVEPSAAAGSPPVEAAREPELAMAGSRQAEAAPDHALVPDHRHDFAAEAPAEQPPLPAVPVPVAARQTAPLQVAPRQTAPQQTPPMQSNWWKRLFGLGNS